MQPEALVPANRLLLCACGSIGIAHIPTSVVNLQAICPNLEIEIVLSNSAQRLVSMATFRALTRRGVYVTWRDYRKGGTAHVDLSAWAELLLVMPATANVLGKAAHGIADDLLTSCLLAATCPTIYVPSMNSAMWSKPVVQRNVRRLRKDGAVVIDPVPGVQASTGAISLGSMAPLSQIITSLACEARRTRLERDRATS